MELFRESAVGQIVKAVVGEKWMKYPEEEEHFRWEALVSAACVAMIIDSTNDILTG